MGLSQLTIRGALVAILLQALGIFASPVVNPLQLKYLGTVDGKSIFGEDQTMTWREAKDYCTASSMALLEVRTQHEVDFLNEVLPNEFEYDGFWTAGRESRSPNMMIWEDSLNELEEPVRKNVVFGVWEDYKYCLTVKNPDNFWGTTEGPTEEPPTPSSSYASDATTVEWEYTTDSGLTTDKPALRIGFYIVSCEEQGKPLCQLAI